MTIKTKKKFQTSVSAGLTYAVFSTGWGWMGALSSPNGLRVLTLPAESEDEARYSLGPEAGPAKLVPGGFADLAERLNAYFAGHRITFEVVLDLEGRTSFERQVWSATSGIPRGETQTYGEIATQIGNPRAARAVGQALGRNPLPVIIPCHRVLACGGRVGGYGGGLELKKRLLGVEGAVFSR